MALTDINGREYARFSTVKEGDILEADGGFSCMEPGKHHTVLKHKDGTLYVECGYTFHALDGQRDKDGTDAIIGLYPVSK